MSSLDEDPDDGPAGTTMAWAAPARQQAATPFQARPIEADETMEELSIDEVEEAFSGTMTLGNALPSVGRAALPFAPPPMTPPPSPPQRVSPPAVASPAAPLPAPAPPPPPSPWSMGARDPGTSAIAAPAGVLAMSNAAAITETRAAAKPSATEPKATAKPITAPREAIKLLHFDPKSIDRVRKHEQWRVTLAEFELRLLDEGARDEGQDERDKARRDVLEVLLRGESISVDRVRLAVSAAMLDDGRFEPPLVLVAGEIELPFDELSILKATVAAIRPLSSGDKRLTETIDAVEELAKTPWLEGSSGVAGGLLDRVREAFGAAKRAVGLDYVDLHTERMLLERRCYQSRTLWGKRWIRGILRGGSAPEMPVYLLESLKEEWPMFKRLRVKMIAEAEPREDQYEAYACALKVVAIGRVVTVAG